MAGAHANRIALVCCALVLVVAGLHFTSAVTGPAAVSLYIITLVWPLQKWLEDRLPQLLALAITLAVTILTAGILIALTVWGFGRVGRWLLSNAAQLQTLYTNVTSWLESHGIYVLGLFVEKFNLLWLVRPFQELAQRARDLLGFNLLAFVFIMLGLLEVRDMKSRIEAVAGADLGLRISRLGQKIAAKLRRYTVIRAVASVVTGFMVAAICWIVGIDNAEAWGIIAFVLNFIPFIGPFIATALPTLYAVAQFQSVQAAVLLCLGVSAVQFLIGSYLEPRLCGEALSISPFLVVFSVFFWALIWGIPGAVIGVPIAIAVLTICEAWPSTAWISGLLSGTPKT